MNRPYGNWIVGIVATSALWLATGQPAFAIGYWNIPGNFCQCFGYGWGPGYHVPLVLGPLSADGLFAHNTVRLPAAPSPSPAWNAIQLPPAAATSTYFQPSLLIPANQAPGSIKPAAVPGPVFR